MRRLGNLTLLLLLSTPMLASAGERSKADAKAALAEQWSMPRPSRADREKACKGDKDFRCESTTKYVGAKKLPINVFYGWNVGKSHPFSDSKPPPYGRLLNGLDQCGWFHDRGAWRWNPRTKVCEGLFMCSNTIGLWKCASAYKPETTAEREAKDGMMRSIGRIGEICIRPLYKNYGVQFVKDRHGSQWLSDKAVAELADSFVKCKPAMAIPGFGKLAKILAERIGEANVNAANKVVKVVAGAAKKVATVVKGAAGKTATAVKAAAKKAATAVKATAKKAVAKVKSVGSKLKSLLTTKKAKKAKKEE